MNKRQAIENDLWFARQVATLGAMRYGGEVDVVERVMERIERGDVPRMPVVMAMPRRRKTKIATGVAAACLVGVVLVSSALRNEKVKAGKQKMKDISSGLADIYGFCQNYAEGDDVENDLFEDNPIMPFLK